MNIRDLLDKLDDIEQQKLLDEAEDLLEKVGLRLNDYVSQVRGITDSNERAAKIGEIARQWGYSGMFDPITGKFVNADGKFAFFGAYEAEVKRLAELGLIPDAAKTSAVLGLMGQAEKEALPNSQRIEALLNQIDKADELIKKALEEPATNESSLAESLIKSFGINTNLLEAITPEEHQLIKKTRKDIEPLLKKANPDAVEYKINYDNYVKARNQLIKQIQTLIEKIKALGPAKPTSNTTTTTTRRGSSANESVSVQNKQIICELRATDVGKKNKVKIYEPDASGYLSPDQVKHNLAMLKKGWVELDWKDHINANVKDFTDMATFGFASKAAAYMDSLRKGSQGYDAELAKYQSATDAYNTDKNAGNLRNAVRAVTGYEMSQDNPFGNITPGDVGGLFVGGAGLWNAGAKTVAKAGGGKVAQTVAGLTTSVVAPTAAALTIGNIDPNKIRPGQLTKDQIIEIQKYLKSKGADLGKTGPKKDGIDGVLGDKTKTAIKKYGLPGASQSAPVASANNSQVAPVASANNSQVAPVASANNSQVAPVASANNSQVAPVASANNSRVAPTLGNIDPSQLQSALVQAGVKGKALSAEQILAIADALGIKEGANESTELSHILKLSGLNEAPVNWIGNLIRGGADDVGRATADAVSHAAPGSAGRMANITPSTINWNGKTWRLEGNVYKAGNEVKSVDDMLRATGRLDNKLSPGGTRVQGQNTNAATASRRAQGEVDNMVRGAQTADNVVAGGADDAARAAAGSADDAARAAAGGADDVARAAETVARAGGDDAAKGLLYKLGYMGGRFARLIKNNKFLALLIALAGLGYYLITRPNTDTTTDTTTDVNPFPGPRPNPNTDNNNEEDKKKEEERKRNLDELNKLLKRLYDGWPTDPETAETISAGVAVGGAQPAGFKPGASGEVSGQPASNTRGYVDPIAAAGARNSQELRDRNLLPSGSGYR